jgi:regulatory protein
MEDSVLHPKKKYLSQAEAVAKIRHYCAYQERSHREVKTKLRSFGLSFTQIDDILAQLITDGFLNEERFAKAFAGGKFRMKQWGRLKIENELQAHGLTARCIAIGLKEINSADYRKTLEKLLDKKLQEYAPLDAFTQKKKAAAFAIAKGYEPDLVWQILKNDD